MSVIENIVRAVRNLPLREQVEVARYVHRLGVNVQEERAELLGRMYGALSDEDGSAFEQAMASARRIDAHG